jgi:leader peptidase (prepilin peptidase) / N-methyltransferase
MAVIAAVAGLVTGSWLTTAIARVPQRRSLLRPLAQCPRCGAHLRAADMIPLAGWLRRRGRCRDCGEPFGGWYPAAELLTAVIFAALALRLGFTPALPAFCYLAAVGVALAIIDIQHKRLPDALTLTSYPVALALLGLAVPGTAHGGRHFAGALLGLACVGLFYLVQALIYPAGMGWGDVKLAGLVGLYLGWLGAAVTVAGVIAGYLLAAAAGITLLVTRRATRKSSIPFGPFMLAGALIVIVASGVVGSRI